MDYGSLSSAILHASEAVCCQHLALCLGYRGSSKNVQNDLETLDLSFSHLVGTRKVVCVLIDVLVGWV